MVQKVLATLLPPASYGGEGARRGQDLPASWRELWRSSSRGGGNATVGHKQKEER